ncbi:hypothetical protein ACVOMV_26490 (plasmid) [Mesorhizobium atlanticum]
MAHRYKEDVPALIKAVSLWMHTYEVVLLEPCTTVKTRHGNGCANDY